MATPSVGMSMLSQLRVVRRFSGGEVTRSVKATLAASRLT
jgi:hypothetical protein